MIDAVHRLLRVPEGLEAAIEAALAEHLAVEHQPLVGERRIVEVQKRQTFRLAKSCRGRFVHAQAIDFERR